MRDRLLLEFPSQYDDTLIFYKNSGIDRKEEHDCGWDSDFTLEEALQAERESIHLRLDGNEIAFETLCEYCHIKLIQEYSFRLRFWIYIALTSEEGSPVDVRIGTA